MKFNLTVDKRAEAVIDGRLCVNCGKCGQVCPAEAVDEYRRTVYCMFPDCGDENCADGAFGGAGRGAENFCTFSDAHAKAVESGCTAACPLGIVPQTVAALVQRGDLDGAYSYIAEKNPLPRACSAICEEVCSGSCMRGSVIDEPLNIRALERYALSRAGAEKAKRKYTRRFDEKVAVIGSGPAGLAAASRLAQAGYGVTIFERDSRPGGSLYWAVPDFRIDRAQLVEEISELIAAGIDIRYHCNVVRGAGGGTAVGTSGQNGSGPNGLGRDGSGSGESRPGGGYPLSEIMREGFSACVIATGASDGQIPAIPGSDAGMVFDGVTFMHGINGKDGGLVPGDRVIVEGGSELAADICRTLRRMGRNVLCIFAADQSELGMSEESLNAMIEEGVQFRDKTEISWIMAGDRSVEAVEVIRTGYAPDENGRMLLLGIKGSEAGIECDTVVFADDQCCAAGDVCGAETYPDGCVKTDADFRTSRPMVFACGDAAGMGRSLPEAMASGIAAADAVGRALHGTYTPGIKGALFNAPDISAIYSENVQKIHRQSEQMIRMHDPESAGGSMAFTEDVLALVRAAGIKEQMPAFLPYDEEGMPKQKVAVVGGGLSGITAAIDLAEAGYMPTIFEKEPALGGRLRWLASEKRVDKALLDSELEKIERSGISVICNVQAGVTPDIKALFSTGYKSVLFATGETRGRKPDLENADCRGVFEAVSLMGKLIGHEKVRDLGNQVIVTGSDELTFDVARMLKAAGAQVIVLAPCSRGMLKSGVASVAAALDEGIDLVTGIEVISVNAVDGHLTGVVCRVSERKVDIDISCDTLVFGDAAVPDTRAIKVRNSSLDIDENGYIQVDEKLITSMYGVFSSCGLDMSPQEAGHAGAEAVRCFLESREFPKVPGVPGFGAEKAELTGAAVKHEMIEGSRAARRGFVSGSRVLEPHRAAVEASRCLGCGYRSVDPARCMGCGVCVTVCPSGAVTMRSIEPVMPVQPAADMECGPAEPAPVRQEAEMAHMTDQDMHRSPVPPAGGPVAETGAPHEEQEDFAGPSAPADPQVQPLHEDAQGVQTREEMQAQEQYEENTADAAPEELVPETVQPEGFDGTDDVDGTGEADEVEGADGSIEPEVAGEAAQEPGGELISEADVTAGDEEIAEGAGGAADAAGTPGMAEQAAEVTDPAAAVTDEEEEADI